VVWGVRTVSAQRCRFGTQANPPWASAAAATEGKPGEPTRAQRRASNHAPVLPLPRRGEKKKNQEVKNGVHVSRAAGLTSILAVDFHVLTVNKVEDRLRFQIVNRGSRARGALRCCVYAPEPYYRSPALLGTVIPREGRLGRPDRVLPPPRCTFPLGRGRLHTGEPVRVSGR